MKIKEAFLKVINNKIFISILMASLTYFAICDLGIIKTYHEVSWIIYFCLIGFFYKTDIYNKKYKKDILIFSLIFSFLIIFGSIVYSSMYDTGLNVFVKLLKIKNLYYFFGIFNPIFILLTNLIPTLIKGKLKNEKKLKLKPIYVFIISFIIIFLCWLPYFLSYYPGTLSPDSIYELNMIISNFNFVIDHHPIIHVLTIAIPFKIGLKIFGTASAAVACYTITQMIIMASIFSSLIVFLYNRKVNKFILLIIMLFYAILPMHGYYSITMWKDVIFAGTLLLLIMEIIKLLEKKENLTKKDFISFIIVSILCIFYRSNAVYMYIVVSLIILIIFRKKYKVFLVPIIIVFSTYLVVKGPIFKIFNISNTESAEYIGIPLQQISRMVYKDAKFTKKEKELINNLIPIEEMKKNYRPDVVDYVKFNQKFKIEEFEEHKIEYLKLWLNLVRKHPATALESYSINTLGYWYPGVEYWSVCNYIWDNGFDLKIEPKSSYNIQDYVVQVESRERPILNMEWSIGLCLWIILIFGYVSVKKHGKEYLCIYSPIFGMWLTMLIATPIFAEFRYMYGIFTCLPLLIIYPYINKKRNNS